MSEARADTAARLARGVQSLLHDMGYDSLCEVKLRSRRRVDVMGINEKGRIVIVEIKSSAADFRVDEKWSDYLEFCDAFYFAVDESFPIDLLPEIQGLIIADGFTGAVVRPAMDFKLNGSRRRNITLRFARTAANRLRLAEASMKETNYVR
ncbi:MmcB family DNA repair protein [Sneathiella sp.]|uniref:MmcB family DNA repair protein n=1 Tax=Sneathiella sp. TaxID=1964365 RepID=UPI00356767F8